MRSRLRRAPARAERLHARAGNRAAHRHQRLDRQRAALPGAGAGSSRSRRRAARRVSVGERSPARLSQPGHRRHGHQPGRAVRARRGRVAAADHPGRGRVARRRRGRGPPRHADDAGPQGQVGRGGKRRARRVRAEPGAGAQRHAGERCQRRAPGVERAAERVREGPGRRRRHVRPVSRPVPAGRRHDAVRQHADSGRDRRSAGGARDASSRSSPRRSRRCSPAGSTRSTT